VSVRFYLNVCGRTAVSVALRLCGSKRLWPYFCVRTFVSVALRLCGCVRDSVSVRPYLYVCVRLCLYVCVRVSVSVCRARWFVSVRLCPHFRVRMFASERLCT